MICCETDTAILVWMDASLELYAVEVAADHDLQKQIVEKAADFMAAVEAELMPDWIELEARHIIAMHPTPNGSTETTYNGWRAVAAYWDHKTAEKHHKQEAALMRDEIAVLIADFDELVYNGDVIVTFKARATAAGFDKTRFKEEHPGLSEEYGTPPGTTRVLALPKSIKQRIEDGQ